MGRHNAGTAIVPTYSMRGGPDATFGATFVKTACTTSQEVERQRIFYKCRWEIKTIVAATRAATITSDKWRASWYPSRAFS